VKVVGDEHGTGTTTSSDQAAREPTEEVVITLNGRRYRQAYTAGESILETARRAGLAPPFSCEAGDCGSCMALLQEGEIEMEVNQALEPEELEEGWRLTCQGYPVTKRVAVEYPD
jgi:ferredoxin